MLDQIGAALQKAVLDNAPAASRDPRSRSLGWALRRGAASIRMEPVSPVSADAWAGFPPAFDLVGYSEIAVSIPEDRTQFTGQEHSLWFSDAQQEGVFRWYETAFMISPLRPLTTKNFPFVMNPGPETGRALRPGIAEWQVARPFLPVDQGDTDAFIERWLGSLGLAAAGRLTRQSASNAGQAKGSFRR